MRYKGVTQPEQKKEQMFVPQKNFKLMILSFYLQFISCGLASLIYQIPQFLFAPLQHKKKQTIYNIYGCTCIRKTAWPYTGFGY